MDYLAHAKELFDGGMQWNEVNERINADYPEVNCPSGEALRKRVFRNKTRNHTYEDKKEPPEIDTVAEYRELLKRTNAILAKLDTKQTEVTLRVPDSRPIGIAFWGDWHLGERGVSLELFEDDLEMIADTEGLRWVGLGDYKGNYQAGMGRVSNGMYEAIAPPHLQDMLVLDYLEDAKHNCLALVRGCFLADSPVRMADGTEKPIQEIAQGDAVMTHTGQAKNVVRVFRNPYDGEVVRVKVSGFHERATATADHKYLAIRKEKLRCLYRNRTCKPYSASAMRWCKNRSCAGLEFDGLGEWTPIGDLKKGDYLLVPRYKSQGAGAITPDELYLYGLFLAEGHYEGGTDRTGVGLTFSNKEASKAETAARLFKDLYGLDATIAERPERNTLSVRAYSTELGTEFYSKLGKYAHSKRISAEVMAQPMPNLLALAAGFVDGDAHQRPNGAHDLTLTTISRSLAYQLHTILIGNGIYATLRQQHRKNRDYDDFQLNISSWSANKLAFWSERVGLYGRMKAADRAMEIGDYFAVPIASMKRFQYSGTVYNFEVEQDHSYVAGGVAVKNCHDDWDKSSDRDFIEAMARNADTVNLWHGGIIHMKFGNQLYRIGVGHKYIYESSLNTTNAQRRFAERFAPIHTVALAHKHFVDIQHVRKNHYVTTNFIRTGSYKRYDEHGQKIARYSGEHGVPLVVYFPDREETVPFRELERGIEYLERVRANLQAV